jgi:FkbH-like protein
MLSELPWLLPPPGDFNTLCRTALNDPIAERKLQFLAGHALNLDQLTRLARVLKRARETRLPLPGLIPIRLGYLSNATTSLIIPAFVATSARYGIALEVIETGFGQVAQEALSSDSELNRARPDLVLLSINHTGLPLRCELGNSAAAQKGVDAAIDYVIALANGVQRHCGATVIFETVAQPPELLFGSFDFSLPGSLRHCIEAFNRGLSSRLAGTPHLLLDTAGLAQCVGLAEWHAPTQWYHAKLGFAAKFIPLYAEQVARLIAAARGKSRRCLVLDLDNTLWGGVIGDDDLSGIVVGEGSSLGEAFLNVQRTALALRDRGIILAVASKNEEATARLPFRQHPDMLLREEHITVFQANYTDKAANLRAIAQSLSLGLDSLVLLDDNPVERYQVRQTLPEVAVPELPDDAALYARVLLAAGYFEGIAYSEEDRARASYYKSDAKRAILLEATENIDEFLRSLACVVSFKPFDRTGRERITQLINKSNQFNLTTRRYAQSEIAEFEIDPRYFTLQVRLADRFGDNGMISAVICRKHDQSWEFDTWVMSCRVLGRKVEVAILQEIVRQARIAGATRLIGRFIPTHRNGLVRDHYAKLGFARIQESEDGSSTWVLELANFTATEHPLKIEYRGALGVDTRQLVEATDLAAAQ